MSVLTLSNVKTVIAAVKAVEAVANSVVLELQNRNLTIKVGYETMGDVLASPLRNYKHTTDKPYKTVVLFADKTPEYRWNYPVTYTLIKAEDWELDWELDQHFPKLKAGKVPALVRIIKRAINNAGFHTVNEWEKIAHDSQFVDIY